MKKLIFLGSAIFIMAASVATFVFASKANQTVPNPMLDDNIEALSDGEYAPEEPRWTVNDMNPDYIICVGGGDTVCPIDNV